MLAAFSYVRFRGKQRRGRGPRKTQTVPFAARLFAAAELGRPACWSRPRVRRPLSPASGNTPFVLCQCPQKSLLLSRLRPGRRSPSLCPVIPPSVLSPKPRLPRAAQYSSTRPCCGARTSRHFLSTATRLLPRGAALFETTRTARSRLDQRDADRLRPRRELAPASQRSRLFFRSPAASRPDQFTGLRRLLSAHHLPLSSEWTRRQPLRPQHHYGRRSSIPSRLQG